mmetsp:Transcript_1146/g.3006  ORF Transcript_1146/g.3006 Transcript_1146/m.3006 type:complete len:278 (+) Transcript_1146:35-868(+)
MGIPSGADAATHHKNMASGAASDDNATNGAKRSGELMRRNHTEGTSLQHLVDSPDQNEPPAGGMRRNISSSTLSELRRREQQSDTSGLAQGTRKLVIEAVTFQLLRYALGKDRAQAEMQAAEEGSTPPGISATMQQYITTIVKQLELPNSCIIAALLYIERAVGNDRFSLSLQNWQPCLLAAFVVAAKLAFDEPVWNEDFVKALRISNVQVSQISRWEADFLQLINYNSNVDLSQYASLCFKLQQWHEALHGKQAHFFTYLMGQPAIVEAGRQKADK